MQNNNKTSPNKIKDKNIIIGIPIIFQLKYEMPLYLNYPFKIYFSCSNSLKIILFQVKNSFPVTYSLFSALKNYGKSKKV